MPEVDSRIKKVNDFFSFVEIIVDKFENDTPPESIHAVSSLKRMVDNVATLSFNRALHSLDDDGFDKFYVLLKEFASVLAKLTGMAEEVFLNALGEWEVPFNLNHMFNKNKYLEHAGLALVVSKINERMDVYFKKDDISPIQFHSINIVTNVIRGNPDSRQAEFANLDYVQANGTFRTQIRNGIYDITKVEGILSDQNNVYGGADLGLALGVVQSLVVQKAGAHGNLVGSTVLDSGYKIHITPYLNTLGCIGIYYELGNSTSKRNAEAIIQNLIELYNLTKQRENAYAKVFIES